MAYDVIEPNVENIKRMTKGKTGLSRAIAELSIEQGLRLMNLAKDDEGSERKGYLEGAINQLEVAYNNHPESGIASLLRDTYKKLGDVKKDLGMPGYELDYNKSDFYARHVKKVISRGNRTEMLRKVTE